MINRKICLLGAFAVGKTSLARRFVHGVFDERYLTTLGVKIDTKTIDLPAGQVKLVVWDIEGSDPADEAVNSVGSRMEAYLQGTDGVMLVADGTRPATVEAAQDILQWLIEGYPGIPVMLLLNKADLVDEWQADPAQMEVLPGLTQCFTTSALSGENVEDTFVLLAEKLTGKNGSRKGHS